MLLRRKALIHVNAHKFSAPVATRLVLCKKETCFSCSLFSAPAKGNFTIESPPPTTVPTTTKKPVKAYFPAEIDIETGGAKIDIGKNLI